MGERTASASPFQAQAGGWGQADLLLVRDRLGAFDDLVELLSVGGDVGVAELDEALAVRRLARVLPKHERPLLLFDDAH